MSVTMTDQIGERTLSLAVRISKLTTAEIVKALEKLLSQLGKGAGESVKTKEPDPKEGKQTLNQLRKQHGGLVPLELTDPKLRLLNREMKRSKIDFAVTKDGKGKYCLHFKGSDAGEMTRAFKKYTKKLISRANGKPSISNSLAAAKLAAQALESGREKVKDRGLGALGR